MILVTRNTESKKNCYKISCKIVEAKNGLIPYQCMDTFSIAGQIQQSVFDHFTNEQGFIVGESFFMISDPNGLLWISTEEGLASYDSKTFKFNKHHPNDSNSLFHNYCNQLVLDKRGWIWIITNNNLNVFNPATQQFKHIKLKGDHGLMQFYSNFGITKIMLCSIIVKVNYF